MKYFVHKYVENTPKMSNLTSGRRGLCCCCCCCLFAQRLTSEAIKCNMYKEINEGLDGRLNSSVNVFFLIATANSVVHLCFFIMQKKKNAVEFF